MREDVRHMNGNITNICTNDYGNQTYGFILGEDGRDYFFHRNNLINCSIVRLQEGDPVEFTPELDQREPDKTSCVPQMFANEPHPLLRWFNMPIQEYTAMCR